MPYQFLRQYSRSLLFGILLAAPALSYSAGANVVELFTSHGCSSCPPADALIADLIEADPDLVALEFHVDYWNNLVHGSSGNWVDPFSSEAYTLRQRLYNESGVNGRPGVYTPQMIVNGNYAAVGSDKRRITAQLKQQASQVDVRLTRTESEQLNIDIANPEGEEARVWLVVFDIKKVTNIKGGENKDLVITNHHIVKSIRPVETVKTGSMSVSVPLVLAAGEGCAVLVQGDRPGPVLGAANCPVSL